MKISRTRAVAAAAGLLALFVIGQGVSLRLIRAGKEIGYQHWLAPAEMLAPGHRLATLFLIGQAGVVVAAWILSRGRWRRRPGAGRPAGVLLALLAVAGVAAAPSRDPAAYVTELAVAVAAQILQLANLLVALALLPSSVRGALHRWLMRRAGGGEGRGGNGGGVDRFALGAAAFAVVATGLLALFVYERHPHIPDEIGYLIQARYFGQGKLYLAVPPAPEAFPYYMFMMEGGRWYSGLPPGWPLVLAGGSLLGMAWLVNPLLSGANVLLAHALVRDLYGRRTARLVTVMLCLSPWFLFLGMSFMNHQWAMTCALVAALGFRQLATGTARPLPRVLGAGLALGMLGAIRPLEAVAAAALLGIAAIAGDRRPGWRRLLPAAAVAAVAVLASLPQLAYNRFFTGSAGRFPVMELLEGQYGRGTNALGFGANRGFGWTGLDPLPGHGPADVVINSVLNLSQINLELLGWSCGSLLVLALFVFAGRKKSADWLMISAIAAVAGAHAFYWFSGGPDFGARYWYLVLLPCLVLTARGLPLLGRLAGVGRSGGLIAGLALTLAASATFLPWRATDKYHDFRGMRPDVRTLVRDGVIGPGLVLVRGPDWPDYASASAYNPLDLDAPAPVFARDTTAAATDRLLRHYADRDVWVLEGPTLTGDGYRVVSGPTPARRMLEERRNGGAGQ